MQPSSPFVPVSPQAESISTLFIVTLVMMGVILAIVAGLVLYISFRYRERPGMGQPPLDFGRRKLEIAWTVGPALLMIVLFILTLRSMQTSDPAVPAGAQPDLVITAHQWWWELEYPKSGVVTANEIHLPVGQKYLVRVKSADVIHSFWVPQLARKMDAIPGHPNHLWLESDSVGTFLGSCSEYCGAQHAWMRLRVIVQRKNDFAAWQQQQLQYPAPSSNPQAAKGAALYGTLTCLNCHVMQKIGPDLSHVASRETLGAGVLTNTPANLARWLKNPQAIKPGSHMPDLKLTDEQVRDLVAYLETQK